MPSMKRTPSRRSTEPPVLRSSTNSSSRPPEELFACYASLTTPSREAMGEEAMRRLEEAMDQLPEDYREAITLHRLYQRNRTAPSADGGV